jgi:hypothetical protein
MDIILPGSRTPPKVSGPTAAKPLAGRKEAGGGCLPPPSPLQIRQPIRFLQRADEIRRSTRPRPGRKMGPQRRRVPRFECCPQARLRRIQGHPEESGGAVKGGSTGARSARTLEGPEHSPTIAKAGQAATCSPENSTPSPWHAARQRQSILRECSAPSRLPSGACGGLDHACALPGVGLYRPQSQLYRTRSALHRWSLHSVHDERPSGRGLFARGARVYRAHSRPGAERHDGLSAPGGGIAGGGPRPPRACTT